jgi:hypothetical protein
MVKSKNEIFGSTFYLYSFRVLSQVQINMNVLIAS